MKPGPSTLWPTVAPQWILNLPENLEKICYDFYKSFFYDNRYEMYVKGLGNTLLLTLLALIMGIVIGIVIALLVIAGGVIWYLIRRYKWGKRP